MIIDAVVSLAGLVTAPLFSFLQKKFIPSSDNTVESTLSTLATTKPEAIEPVVNAKVKLIDAEIRKFNRDVIGNISPWVSNLRASIRPGYVVWSLIYTTIVTFYKLPIDPGLKYTMELCISNWFGSRIIK